MKQVWWEHPPLCLSWLHAVVFFSHFVILLIVLKPPLVAAFLVMGRNLLVFGRWSGTASLPEVSPWGGGHCFSTRVSVVLTLEQGLARDKGAQGLCFGPWWIRAHPGCHGGFSGCWAIKAALFAIWFFVWVEVAMPGPPGCWLLVQRAR